jgi:ATP-dependent DNA helicase RecG
MSDAPAPARNPLQKAMAKMGLVRDIDLALHLPLRYEDETRIVKLRDWPTRARARRCRSRPR